jgi:spore coat polysaccharide biosynthesis protein SpsF
VNADRNIGALIPVRLTSERLPGKALREIQGKPVVHHLLDRVFASRYIEPHNAVVCTTEDPEDDALVEAVEAYGASVFRGDRDDIIKRFRDAMAAFDFDAVVQVDGDDPLTDTEYMDRTMDALLADPELGIVWSEGLPLGVNCKSFSRAAMETVYEHYQHGQNDTGFIYFFTKTDLVKKATVRPASPDHILDDARLTLDYDVDFEVFRRIFESLQPNGEVAKLADVVRFLKANPDVMAINANLDEEYWQRTRDKAQLSYRDSDGKSKNISL